jgi:hypothetical protein
MTYRSFVEAIVQRHHGANVYRWWRLKTVARHLRSRDVRADVFFGERRHPLWTLRLDCVDARPREWPRAAGCGEALRGLEVEHGGA